MDRLHLSRATRSIFAGDCDDVSHRWVDLQQGRSVRLANRAGDAGSCSARSSRLELCCLPDRFRPAHAQNEASWIGKRVVQTSSDLTLREGDTAVASVATVPLYRVEGSDGSWLWLRAEPGDVERWAKADEVIAVDQAVDFFTRRIRKVPRDPFLYAAQRLSDEIGVSLTSPCVTSAKRSTSMPIVRGSTMNATGVVREGRVCQVQGRSRERDRSSPAQRAGLLQTRRHLEWRGSNRTGHRRLHPFDQARSQGRGRVREARATHERE